MTADEPASIADRARAVHLCDQGAPGWAAVVTVAPDGTEDLWLLHAGYTRADCGPGCCHDMRPPHELTGPLPAPWRARVAAAAEPRCGRPTATGEPCRRPAPDGEPCWQHREVNQ